MPMIEIQQTGSPIRRHHLQRKSLKALGLNRIGRIVNRPDTPQTRGLIAKVRHLVRATYPPAEIEVSELSRRRFEALAGYARDPITILFLEEISWHATSGERLIGMLVRDRADQDYGWIILGRDERLRFRAIDVNHSLESADAARDQLFGKLKEWHGKPDEAYHQGDSPGRPTDFFRPVVLGERLSATFRTLTEQRRYSPARGIIAAMMRFYQDTDGNFVEQFQTTAFDARIWELYLFATFTELGYAPLSSLAVPDFIFSSPAGSLGIEATSVNPSATREIKPPGDPAQLLAYIEKYIPIRLARVLNAKLEKRKPYWDEPEMEGKPFVIAVQDFHSPGSMRMISGAMSDYVFGVRERMEGGYETIEEHVWNDLRELSGFFNFPNAENINAVIVNTQGTLPKFNRMGYIAEFGERNVRMVRTGAARGPDGPVNFQRNVRDPGYSETWVEGMVVFHNPNARIPLDPGMIPGASHEFLQPDGTIVALVPEFHPLFSMTQITIGD
jgi:ribosomal protein L30